jgi:two-component system, sensor histidine kinase
MGTRNVLTPPVEKLPWWTWVVPLPIFFVGTLISLEAQITTGTSLLYFPLPLGIVLSYWWGPRVLPAFYLNAVGCAGLWGLDRTELWPVYGFPELVFVVLSWFLFVRLYSGKVWLPDTMQVIYFLLLGILIPLVIYKSMLEAVFVMAGDTPKEKYWSLMITTGFGDFISSYCVSIPLLCFLTRFMHRKGLLVSRKAFDQPVNELRLGKSQWFELVGVAITAYLINIYLGFIDYWFLNGLLSLYVAIRFGFAATILMNSYIIIITYAVPAAAYAGFSEHFLESTMLKTQLGTALLYVFTIITGRLVSDMLLSKAMLSQQNKELNVMNAELDRFVYSVSHDLSAPLKSILGLVNISRMTTKEGDYRQYFDLIEKSVHKLETFVHEVLDYSKTKRMEVVQEEVNLKNLAGEVFHDLQFIEGLNEIKIDYSNIEPGVIITDKNRLKIILHNLITNAIKFRKKDFASFITLYTKAGKDKLTLFIEDNGEGIRPELQEKIFDMFFKGTEKSNGSGLGLYIAKEAATKINARISVQSTYGSGSVFSIELN